MHVTKILSTHNHSFGTTSMRSCSSYGTNVPDGDSTPSPWYLVQVVDGYVGNPAAFPARPFCWSVQAVFARFARCGHIWETHGSAGATVGVGYGTALAAGIQRLQRVKRPSTQTTARACMHGRPPCRPNSPRLHDHACTVSTGRSNDALALPVALAFASSHNPWVTAGPRRRRRTHLSWMPPAFGFGCVRLVEFQLISAD
jgi:hypothetical protein